MTLGGVIGCTVVGLGVLALIMFPGFRQRLSVLCGGLLNNIVIDKAKTPDGAKAIYQQAIDEAQTQYNKASDMLQKTAGRLEVAKKNLAKAQGELADVESKCDNLVKNGRIESAYVLSEKRDEILATIEQYTQAVKSLEPMVNDAKMIATQKEQQLRKLKTDSKRKIAELEMNQQMGEMYDQMDELKRKNAVSKLLDSVNDGCEDAKQRAIGARAVHENKLETKAGRAMIEAKNIQSSDYIASLQRKYNKVGERR